MKRLKVILPTFLVMSIIISILLYSVYAKDTSDKIKVLQSETIEPLLKIDDANLNTMHIYNSIYGKLYPIYFLGNCTKGQTAPKYLNRDKNSIDTGLKNVLLNGYPFVGYKELGCNNEEEAYTATQNAALCYLNKNTKEKYSAIGEAGKRTLEAMNKILEEADKNTKSSRTPFISITSDFNDWKIDGDYLYKIYTISPINSDILENTVLVEAYSWTTQPEKLANFKFVDMDNQERTEFAPNEKFKILFPKNVSINAEFSLSVNTVGASDYISLATEEGNAMNKYAVIEMYKTKKWQITLNIENQAPEPEVLPSPEGTPSATPSEMPSEEPSITPSESPSEETNTTQSELPSEQPKLEATPSAFPNVDTSASPNVESSATPSASPTSISESIQQSTANEELEESEENIVKEKFESPKQQETKKNVAKKLPITGM